jgi:myo-inositol-1(or 4)-monophosphatase
MSPILSEMIHMAYQAGEILRGGYGEHHQISHKGAIDIVTEVDHRSEAYLIREVKRKFPSHRIVTEETGEVVGSDCCVWYIDPLDGTVNYAHGIPIFAVSIAYAEDGQVRLGVVYEPMRDECFTAELGLGAWLNGKPIRVSENTDLDQALLVTGFAYDIRTNPHNNLDLFTHFMLRTRGVRRMGSAAVDLGYVAVGRFDGYWEIKLESYDIAAGGLIASEAGAQVTNCLGEKDYLTAPVSVLAANPAIYAQLLAEIQSQVNKAN